MEFQQRMNFEQREKIKSTRQELREIRREIDAAKDRAQRYEQVKRAKKKKLELLELKRELRAAGEGGTGNGPDTGQTAAQATFELQTGALPDFVIIGTMKGGTTYLYHLLSQHPLVEPAAFKEPHYFDLVYDDEGVEWYRRCFPAPRRKDGRWTITGEASPGYIFHPLVPERMAKVIPQARLIAVLRNPVDRTYSAYHHRVRNGLETRTFEEAVEASLGDDSEYLSESIYVDQLLRWTQFFDREQLLVLKSEDFFESPQQTLKTVLSFLGLPGWEPGASDLGERRNAGGYEEGMDLATRRKLEEYFGPHNRRLYEFLGTDFGW